MKNLLYILIFFFIVSPAQAQRRAIEPQDWIPLVKQEREPSTPVKQMAIIYADPNGDGVYKNFLGEKTYFGGDGAVYNTFTNLIDANVFAVDEDNRSIGIHQTSPDADAYLQISDKYIICKTFTDTGIRDCITALGGAGEVKLLEGTYYFSAVVNITTAGITITGSGWNTIITPDPNNWADEVLFHCYNSGDNFILRDLKIDGQEAEVATTEISIACLRANARLLNCWFYDIECGGSAAIHLGSYGIMDNCIIESCGSGADAVVQAYDECKITNCQFISNTEPCIYLTYDNCIVSGNTFYDNSDYCITFNSNSDYCTISNNNCLSNSATNLNVPSGSDYHVIYGNLFDQGVSIASSNYGDFEIYGDTVVDGSAKIDFLDMLEMTAPDTPSTNTLRLYTEAIKGFSFFKYLDDTGMKRQLIRDSMILVKNIRGTSIAANRIVYATGSDANIPTVDAAKADSIDTMPAIGVTIEAIANGAYGRVMQVGLLENINTDSLAEGDILYVSDADAGVPVTTAPLSPSLTQEIGTVLVKSATVGAIQIVARGLTGDEYGTAQNIFLIGDGDTGTKTLTFNGVNDGSLEWDSNTSIFTFVGGPIRTYESEWWRADHHDMAGMDPGASGATWTDPSAGTTMGGMKLNDVSETLTFPSDVHSDWDAASDKEIKVVFEVNADNTGGADTDTVDIKVISYFKGPEETTLKTQTNEVATIVGKSAQYKLWVATIPLDYDDPNNPVEKGDKFRHIVNLETDTSEVDDIIVNHIHTRYKTKQPHPEI